MNAADLEEIIRNAVECTPYWVVDKPETHQDPYENAARAVVAALEAAGSVEWGVDYHGVSSYESEAEARRQLNFAQMDVPAILVHRVTGPGTAVEDA